MPSKTLIPRFLLPAHGPAWRGIRIPPSQSLIRVRYASTAPKAKTIVLGKPAKFNPPSHGARLRGNVLPKHYAPELSPAEKAAQKIRNYPGLMPPEGTLAHRIWSHRMLHVFITMGVLFSLGIYTFFLNFVHNSPFKHLVPPISDLWNEPAYFFSAWKNVIIMHEKDKSAKAVDHRMRHLDDVAKRRFFMKMHGIEPKDPVLMVFGKGEKMRPDPVPAAADLDPDTPHNADDQEEPTQRKK
ncbi:hypothetical protein HRG_007879 [Hirsutella rhossiliensis]|uniref:Uncharacterized protein n=1 Tax=Hirsutella rhossiliensis TaxID=111463 RepID=A0A9P8SH77_9HYPO|nr:uncharacterized protein HRG_07879 [Hirsutella rhossiliensis]KAH0960726.1 hypothetical protein HRG_07879 [Hirsutella rhossiliensis]